MLLLELLASELLSSLGGFDVCKLLLLALGAVHSPFSSDIDELYASVSLVFSEFESLEVLLLRFGELDVCKLLLLALDAAQSLFSSDIDELDVSVSLEPSEFDSL